MMSISSSLFSLGAQKQKKKDNDKCQLIVIFFGCTKTKQKKMTMNTSSSLSFLGAQKQNKKTMTNANLSSSFMGAQNKKQKKNNDKH